MSCLENQGCNRYFQGVCKSMCGQKNQNFHAKFHRELQIDIKASDGRQNALRGEIDDLLGCDVPDKVKVNPVPSVQPDSDYGKPDSDFNSLPWNDKLKALESGHSGNIPTSLFGKASKNTRWDQNLQKYVPKKQSAAAPKYVAPKAPRPRNLTAGIRTRRNYAPVVTA